MKRLASLFLALALILCAGCTGQGPAVTGEPEVSPTPVTTPDPTIEPGPNATAPVKTADENEIPLLVYDGSTVRSVLWNVAAGTLSVPGEPLLSVTGAEDRWSVKWSLPVWDGGSSFVGSSTYGVSFEPADGVTLEALSSRHYGEGYTIVGDTLLRGSQRHTLPLADLPAPDGNGETTLLSSRLDGDVLQIVYLQVDRVGHTAYLISGQIDLVHESAVWNSPVQVPENYFHGITEYCLPQFTAVSGNRCYFCGGNTIAWLDLSTGEMGDLSAMTAFVDSLFPDLVRASGQGREFTVSPVGQWGDTCIGAIEYRAADNQYRSVVVYFAWKEDSLVGLLAACEDQSTKDDYTLRTYDTAGTPCSESTAGYWLVRTPNCRY